MVRSITLAALVLVSVAQSSCQVAAAALKGVGCGVNPESCCTRQAGRESLASTACLSDYNCGYGSKCVKAPYMADGYCAKAVDQYGTTTFAAPDPNSVLPGGSDGCSFDTDCPALFYCAKEPGALHGACLKR